MTFLKSNPLDADAFKAETLWLRTRFEAAIAALKEAVCLFRLLPDGLPGKAYPQERLCIEQRLVLNQQMKREHANTPYEQN